MKMNLNYKMTEKEELFKEKRSKKDTIVCNSQQPPATNEGTGFIKKSDNSLLQVSKKAKKSVLVKSYSPSDDDFVKDAFKGKKN